MSNYKNHWTNERVEIKIGKLDEKTTYQIKDVEKIETSFGKRYVLVDDKNNKYWPNKAVEGFIHQHKDIKKFELITSEFKSFLNKKGEEINYLDVSINF